MANQFKVKKRQPIWSIFKPIFQFFKWRGIKVYCTDGKLPEKCILAANHSAKTGPMAYEIAMPITHYTWGAHEMLGNYKSRFKYLRDVFYMQKQNMGKFKATLKAAFEAIFSIYIYKGMKIMGTYQDGRLKTTIKNSMTVLDANKAVMIFPEDSNKGYFDIMHHFFAGFIVLSEQYYKSRGEDLPIYPVYYNHKLKKVVVGKVYYLQELYKQGLNREQAAEFFKNEVNNLYYTYFEKDLKETNKRKIKKR